MKKKLSLDVLKVQSFVTSADAEKTLGGRPSTLGPKLCELITGLPCALEPLTDPNNPNDPIHSLVSNVCTGVAGGCSNIKGVC